MTLTLQAQTQVIVVTGNGRAFSAGGDFEMIEYMLKGSNRFEVYRDTKDLVHNMIRCTKPIISAVNGVAVGAGMAWRSVRIYRSLATRPSSTTATRGWASPVEITLDLASADGHGEDQVLSTDRKIPQGARGRAFRAGELCVPHDELMAKTFEVATELANAPQFAVRNTKSALQQWLNTSSFDQSCALEMLTFVGDDVREGVKALKEKRPPQFPSARL